MPSRRTHDVVATTGEYTDHSGEKKKRYSNCGSAFTDDQGRISIKLDLVPVTPDWSGWLSLCPIEDKQQRQQQPARRTTTPEEARRVNSAHRPAPAEEPTGDGMEEDEILF